MKDERLKQAIFDNAVWCDKVCRTHGKPGEFREEIWLNWNETPPFYPNAITLTKAGTGQQLACLRELVESGIPGEWGSRTVVRYLI